MSDPGPAPWELPPRAAKVSRGRGTSKVPPLSDAARRAIADKRAGLSGGLGVDDCPGCGFWVISGTIEGWAVALDVWRVPYAEAVILERYHLGDTVVLWREYRPWHFDIWAPWNKVDALLEHRCRNRWWLYRSVYVEAVTKCASSE